jgi:DNA (cytosine-5)-methyltransferase 1
VWQEVSEVTISYNRLWKLLIDKSIKRTELKRLAGVSTNVIAKLGKNEPVAMETLAKICTALQCGIDDIVEINSDAGNGGKE